MNLLILSPDYSRRVNWGHQHIRDSLLTKIKNSVQYGEGFRHLGKTHIPDICEDMRSIIGYPEVILMENWKNMRKYTGGDKVKCFKAFIVCDYFPDSRGHINQYNRLLVENKIDLAICNTPDVLSHIIDQRDAGNLPKSLKAVWVPQGVDTDIFKKRDLIKKYDVMAVFGLVSYIYPERPKVQSLVSLLPGVTSLIGDWKSNIKYFDYAKAINQSKIFVCANGINNQVLMKYFEIMASGTLLLTNLPRSYETFGFIPGEHFVTWRDLADLKEKIYYYLNESEIREQIAYNGMEFVRANYSTNHVALRIHQVLSSEVISSKRRDSDVLSERNRLCGLASKGL